MNKNNKHESHFFKTMQFPTKSKFDKSVEESLHGKRVVEKTGPIRPIIPKYLTEYHEGGNPFRTIKYEETRTLKSSEKSRKLFDKEKILKFPICENVSRNIRNKFYANFAVKELEYKFSREEFLKLLENPVHSLAKSVRLQSEPKKSDYDFVVDRRRVCLLELSKLIKEQHLFQLDKNVAVQENSIKKELSLLEREKIENDKLLKNVCENTSDAVKVLDEASFKKHKVIQKLKRARFIKDKLNADCIKLEDEFKILKTYRWFLYSCYNRQNKSVSLVRTSFLSDVQMSMAIKEMERDAKSSLDESEVSLNTEITKALILNVKSSLHLTRENSQETNANNEDVKDVNINSCANEFFNQNNEPLAKLKELITDNFNNSTNSLIKPFKPIQIIFSEQDVLKVDSKETLNDNVVVELDSNDEDDLFMDPQDLVNVLNDLEINNLNLIENVQEQEEICDNLTNRLKKVKFDMAIKAKAIDDLIKRENKNIDELEKSIAFILKTEDFIIYLNKLHRYRSIFYLEDLDFTTIDELLEYMLKQVLDLYEIFFDKDDSIAKNIIEVLCRIESYVDKLYIKMQLYNKNQIMTSKKSVDDRKFKASRLRQKELEKEMRLKKFHDVIEKSKLAPKYRLGRKIMYRSPPLDKKLSAEKVNLESIRKLEENQFFFE